MFRVRQLPGWFTSHYVTALPDATWDIGYSDCRVLSVIAVLKQVDTMDTCNSCASGKLKHRAILPWEGPVPVDQTFEPKRVRSTNSFWDVIAGRGTPLGPKRRPLALMVVVGGILTFFVPLVSTNPPVVGTTDWSAFSIVRQMYFGELPQPICETCGKPIIRSLLALPLLVTLVYLLMIFALVAVCFSTAPVYLARVGLVGIFLSLDTYMPRGGTNFVTKWEFEKTFYGHPLSLAPSSNGPVYYGWLTVAMCAVMGALVLVATHEDLDSQPHTDSLRERFDR
jgi:hypothetical protein